jgi:hypothetical protein
MTDLPEPLREYLRAFESGDVTTLAQSVAADVDHLQIGDDGDPENAMARTGCPSVGVCYLVNSPSLQARDGKKRFTVHGLRKVGIRLQLHLYRAPACEMQRFFRCGVLLRPSPEHGRDHGRWRIFDSRCAHSLPRGAGAQKLVKIYMHLRGCLFPADGPHLFGRGVSAWRRKSAAPTFRS